MVEGKSTGFHFQFRYNEPFFCACFPFSFNYFIHLAPSHAYTLYIFAIFFNKLALIIQKLTHEWGNEVGSIFYIYFGEYHMLVAIFKFNARSLSKSSTFFYFLLFATIQFFPLSIWRHSKMEFSFFKKIVAKVLSTVMYDLGKDLSAMHRKRLWSEYLEERN